MPCAPGASLHTSDPALRRGFDWATAQALAYVVDGAPASPCYEAALPSRKAFCMRDTAHQALGAQVLGRGDCNRNMFAHFARALDDARGYCSHWEIGFDGKPCPVDYASDADFWYNLPANFDVMDACMRMYDWTGDTGYLFDPEMEAFHHVSTHDYVRRWDRDRDGIPDRVPGDGRRGIATYDESPRNPTYRVAADLLAAQYAAYRARARMCAYKGEHAFARQMEAKADALHKLYNEAWWNEAEGHFAGVRLADGTYGGEFVGVLAYHPLYFGIAQGETRIRRQLQYLLDHDDLLCMEERTHMPEILWRYGMDAEAEAVWIRSTSPDYARREYPEVSFCALGAIASGYMGVTPDAAARTVRTRSAVQPGEWAEMNRLPLWGGHINLLHEGDAASTLENLTGVDLTWISLTKAGKERTQAVRAGEAVRIAHTGA